MVRDMKEAFIPKTKVEPARRERYESAVAARREKGDLDVKLSSWIRLACDAQAKRDLAGE